ncbi:MAG: response regulator, partial [Kangiellaceae bacterium]|nr:response regulator [Kangiellaceae bacterium]
MNSQPLRVLVADDSDSNRMLLEMLLGEMSCLADTAENGEVAVEKAIENSYHLLIMDINMPEMDGLEATQVLRAINYDGKIIAHTSDDSIEMGKKLRRSGFDGLLPKPLDPEALQRLVNAQSSAPFVATSESEEKVSDAFEQKVAQLSNQFKEKTSTIAQQLKSALAQQDFALIKHVAHKLRGTAPLYNQQRI